MKSKLEKLKNIDVPKSIKFKESENSLILTMNSSCVNANMQENRAAFEAWALVARAKGYDKVILEEEKNIDVKSKEHYNRFLYRAYCFDKLFDWFILSDNLAKKVQEFYYKYFENKKLIYNVPINKAKEPIHPEAIAEEYFVNNKEITNELLKTNVENFYSQLPVGTFYEKKSNSTRVFTGGKSAIDFWGIEGNILNIVELKVKRNKSLGVLSELFFYVCLMRDFHIKKLASPCTEEGIRGFNTIRNANLKMIKGYILTENIHPQLEIAFEELGKAFRNDKSIKFEKVVHIPENISY